MDKNKEKAQSAKDLTEAISSNIKANREKSDILDRKENTLQETYNEVRKRKKENAKK